MARRKRRRKNPNGNHPGLGAFLGSVLGGIPGHLLQALGARSLGAVVTSTGWIAGGAMGGYYGAKADRQGRGAVGGAVGGIFTPLGAALGGYIGGRKPDKKRRNPLRNPSAGTIALAAGAGIAAAGAGYGLYRVTKGPGLLPGKKALEPSAALQGVVGNSTLEEASFMVSDIRQPILLQTPVEPLPVDDEFERVPVLRIKVERPTGETTIEEPAGAAFGLAGTLGEGDNQLVLFTGDGDYAVYTTQDKAIAYLITGLSTESAQLAYELALIQIGDRGVEWTDPEQRDATIQQILSKIAPKMDWSERLKPHTYGDAAWQAWVGVDIIGTVAHQSFFNKQVLGEV